ncbi:heme o synthase [Psychrobium sp. 1_MG-2023]|uniref:heme o synthase n=1 Tax=Psychrobium sp. 1_MG-2023 TaxID=3062624 RepID=UPI0027340CAD|nr:heme o synthase [Psychrobium sp. 1_MG-2023]MDP2561834.1 heme o synthase [Psychrobium sp. 1_MG-2023]
MTRASTINNNTVPLLTTIKYQWHAYYQLTKPKVILLLLLTAVVGMCLASPKLPNISLLIWGCLGIGMLSSAGAVFNHCIDHNLDIKMARTKRRPIPQGKVSLYQAAVFGVLLSLVGSLVLWFLVNPLTAALTFVSMLGYAVVYTLWLKRATPQNIVIGGIAGAAPPLLGWTTMTGQLDGNALLLVMIIFTWTPPHFWALAIDRVDDYKKTGLPMLPVTHGVEFTKTMILLYTILLMAVGLLPFLTGMSGWFYFVGSSLINWGFFYVAWQLKFSPKKRSPMAVFKYSIYHLMILFIILLFDHYLM